MSLLTTIAVIAFFVAQFTPKGHAFLATNRGALAVVVLSAVLILSSLPGLLVGNLFSVLVVGLWCWIAYPRLGAAKRGAQELFSRARR